MWCRHCQQETPALGPITTYGARCPRCNRTEHAADSSKSGADAKISSAANEASESESDEFPFVTSDVTRRHIQRSLQAAQSTAAAGAGTNTFRLDLGSLEMPVPFSSGDASFVNTKNRSAELNSNDNLNASHGGGSLPRQSVAALRQSGSRQSGKGQSRKQVTKTSSGLGQVFGWGVATCGAMLLGLGIGLIIWATYGGRTLLWGPAIATTIAGQGLMIVGLLQLLANLWSAARHTSAKLTQIHDDLRRVRRTTEEASGRQHATATGFYAELAGGATSDVLLGNLRGQLDQLSSRLRVDQ